MTTFSRPVKTICFSAFLVFCLLTSCRTTEKVPEVRLRPMNAVRIYKKAESNTFNYDRFAIKKINIQFDNGRVRTSFRAAVQAVKDQAVVLTLTKLNMLLARVMLTPDSVVYVNYFEKTFYSGDYEPISELLHFELDFTTIQAVVSANIFALFENGKELREFRTWDEEGYYVLQSETVRKLTRLEDKGKTERAARIMSRMDEEIPVIQTFYFDPSYFLIRKLELKDIDTPQYALLQFGDYEPVADKYYPASVDMVFKSGSSNISVNAKMSGFSTGDGEFVPLKIPEKFNRIYLY
jgi:hypothetical protein